MKTEIRSLTGMRGIGAVLVMAYHFIVVPDLGLTAPAGPGYLMVDLFFVLSGFVMAANYGPKFAPGRDMQASFRRFLQARFARVYPLYGLIVVCVFVLTRLHLMVSASFPVRAFASNILLLQNLGAGWIAPGFAGYIDPPSWSISTEVGAYLIFPALARLTLFRSATFAALMLALSGAVLLALSVAPRAWLGQPADSGALDISAGETLWPLFRCLAGFCIGLVTCRMAARLAVWRRRAVLDASLLLSFAALWLWNRSDFAIVCLFPPLILQVCTDSTPLARLLGGPIPYRLGLWSYAIYLLHWPAMALLTAITARLAVQNVPHATLAAFVVLSVIVVAASAVLYESFERPARTLLRRGFGQPRTAAALEPGAP